VVTTNKTSRLFSNDGVEFALPVLNAIRPRVLVILLVLAAVVSDFTKPMPAKTDLTERKEDHARGSTTCVTTRGRDFGSMEVKITAKPARRPVLPTLRPKDWT